MTGHYREACLGEPGVCTRVWYVAWDYQDFLAGLHRMPDGIWEARYRFRYYAVDADGQTGDAWDGRDTFSGIYLVRDSDGDKLARFMEGLVEAHRTGILMGVRIPPDAWPGVPAVVDDIEVHDGDLFTAIAGKNWSHLRAEGEA